MGGIRAFVCIFLRAGRLMLLLHLLIMHGWITVRGSASGSGIHMGSSLK